MSLNYLEKFEINRTVYGITRDDAGFHCWVGGCGIGSRWSIGEARNVLHSYAVSQNTAEVHLYQAKVDAAERALEKLGNDTFNLGRFRV